MPDQPEAMPDQPRPDSTTWCQEEIEAHKQIRGECLKEDALKCGPLFFSLLDILVFTLAPRFADKLDSQHDLSHIFSPSHPQWDLHFQVLSYLVNLAMAADASILPPLELPSPLTRTQLWQGWLESILKVEVSAPSLRFESVAVAEIEAFLRRRSGVISLLDVRYWYGVLWRQLPLQSPFPSGTMLSQEKAAQPAMDQLKEILDGSALDLAFLAPIAFFSTVGTSAALTAWARTPAAKKLAARAVAQVPKVESTRQGLILLLLVVSIHRHRGVVMPQTPCQRRPSLEVDWTPESLSLYCHALRSYASRFELVRVLEHPVLTPILDPPSKLSQDLADRFDQWWEKRLPSHLLKRDQAPFWMCLYSLLRWLRLCFSVHD